jgi:transcriptional regulator with XRE-family HTH domain
MARSKDLSLVQRDLLITERIAQGDRLKDIALDLGLSISRVSQIHHDRREIIGDDEKREILAAKLEWVLDEKLMALMKLPPQVKVTPSGRTVYEPDMDDPTGKTPDYTRPVYDYSLPIEAAKAFTTVADNLARLYGLNRPKQKERDDSPQAQEYYAWAEANVKKIKELEAKLLEAGIYPDAVEAELVEDDPPPLSSVSG